MYRIREVDPSHSEIADQIREFNGKERFPKLSDEELCGHDCYWWMAYDENEDPVGFAGIVPSRLYTETGYLKRCYVDPLHRGKARLQVRFLRARERKARKIGWKILLTETTNTVWSANNLFRAGYELFEPNHKWAFEKSLYFRKKL